MDLTEDEERRKCDFSSIFSVLNKTWRRREENCTANKCLIKRGLRACNAFKCQSINLVLGVSIQLLSYEQKTNIQFTITKWQATIEIIDTWYEYRIRNGMAICNWMKKWRWCECWIRLHILLSLFKRISVMVEEMINKTW